MQAQPEAQCLKLWGLTYFSLLCLNICSLLFLINASICSFLTTTVLTSARSLRNLWCALKEERCKLFLQHRPNQGDFTILLESALNLRWAQQPLGFNRRCTCCLREDTPTSAHAVTYRVLPVLPSGTMGDDPSTETQFSGWGGCSDNYNHVGSWLHGQRQV